MKSGRFILLAAGLGAGVLAVVLVSRLSGSADTPDVVGSTATAASATRGFAQFSRRAGTGTSSNSANARSARAKSASASITAAAGAQSGTGASSSVDSYSETGTFSPGAADSAAAGQRRANPVAAADDHDDSPGPPVALLPVVLQALQDSPTAGSKERLERHEAFQQEPEDDWSEGMEQALNQFVAAQPEADGLQSQIACRVTQCEVQLFDTKPSISPDHMTRSSVVINRIIRQPWMTTLQLSDMEAGVYKHMTFTLLFLQRRSQQ